MNSVKQWCLEIRDSHTETFSLLFCVNDMRKKKRKKCPGIFLESAADIGNKKSVYEHTIQGGPLTVISRLITPLIGVTTPVAHLSSHF